MQRKFWYGCLLGTCVTVGSAAAETVVNLKHHSDPVQLMGQSVPAKDEIHSYWFGSDGVRFDQGDTSIVMNWAQKKMYVVTHPDKSYSSIELPIDVKKVFPPEVAGMMDQMMQMMGGTTKVTPLDKVGNYAGSSCKFYRIELSMPMMTTLMDSCLSEKLPINYDRFRELIDAQGQLFPNAKWMKEFAKLNGFPLRTDSTVTMMGKTFASWSELIGVEEKPAPAGLYQPPPGYREIPFDPMGQSQQRQRRKG